MSRMGEIHMMVSEMIDDGMEDQQIAQIIANQFDIDEDFALNLVEDIFDELDELENRSDVSNPTWGA